VGDKLRMAGMERELTHCRRVSDAAATCASYAMEKQSNDKAGPNREMHSVRTGSIIAFTGSINALTAISTQ
jgi:hypothetical protein